MEKKELQKFVKSKLKPLGFRSHGNYIYKTISDNYRAGIYLDHHPFCKGYFIEYGGRYFLNTDGESPFFPPFDWEERFLFTIDPAEDLSKYIHEPDCRLVRAPGAKLVDYFEYDVRTLEDFERQFDCNMSELFEKVLDEQFILNKFREDWISLSILPAKTVEKITKLAGLDFDEVMAAGNGSSRSMEELLAELFPADKVIGEVHIIRLDE